MTNTPDSVRHNNGSCLRDPESILKQIDAHAERLRRETGLVTTSRTDAALALLVGSLEAAEKKRKART